MYNIHLLPASFGDSILIEYGASNDLHYILIDGGPHYAFDEIMAAIKKIVPTLHTIELIVVTHIDADHITGIIKLLHRDRMPFEIKDIWFNGWDQLKKYDDFLGGKQGSFLGELLKRKDYPHNEQFNGEPICIEHIPAIITLAGGMEISILSPTKEALVDLMGVWEKKLKDDKLRPQDADTIFEKHKDHHYYKDTKEVLEKNDFLGKDKDKLKTLAKNKVLPDDSEANGSSIAFLASFQNKCCLFAGDAHSEQLQTRIQDLNLLNAEGELSIDAWKLSHHGSKKSTLPALIEMIDCPRILISTDGKYYQHPDKETIAKLLHLNKSKLSFHFNYRSDYTTFWDDTFMQAEHDYETFFPDDGEDWMTVSLL